MEKENNKIIGNETDLSAGTKTLSWDRCVDKMEVDAYEKAEVSNRITV